MRNFRMTIAMVGVGVSVATLGGGLAMAETGVSSTPSAVAATPTGTAQAVTPLGSPALLAITDVATVKTATGTTLHTANVEVGQARETILVNSKGLPLYVYRPDTASMSKVTGELAALWPPLIAKHPTASGSTGVLSTVPTISGRQVPLQVSGQNVENFSVATPQITVNHGNASTTKTAPATTPATGRSGY
jgi:predicted lipoprotein with Yx(FWY)xxD motif